MPTGPADFQLFDCGVGVAHHCVPVRLGDEGTRLLDLGRRITRLVVLLRPVEQRRRDRGVAFLGKVVADLADVLVDAENLLNDDDAALRRAGRIGAIGAKLEAVGRGEREMLTQVYLPMFGPQ